MACECWKKAALGMSEAVLLPALNNSAQSEGGFVPVGTVQSFSKTQSIPAKQGSVAGRGVLRAAGIGANPHALSRAVSAHSARPLLCSARGRLR